MQRQSSAVSCASGLSGVSGRRRSTSSIFGPGSVVLSERIVDHVVTVPRKVVREEVTERVVVVPEKRLVEEIVEDQHRVREKVVQVSQPVIQEQYVQLPPRTEIKEKIIKVPQIVIEEVVKQVPRVRVEERIIHVPKTVYKERINEVPQIEYEEVTVEKVVDVPKIEETVIINEVVVPHYVDKPVPNLIEKQVPRDVDRSLPVPVEATTFHEFNLPHLKSQETKVPLPIYVPRFVHVPVPSALFDAETLQASKTISAKIEKLAQTQAPSLAELEALVQEVQRANFAPLLDEANFKHHIDEAWKAGRLAKI